MHCARSVCRPYNDFWAIQEYVLTLVFSVDFVLQFFRAYHDPKTGVLVTQKGSIARHYAMRCGARQAASRGCTGCRPQGTCMHRHERAILQFPPCCVGSSVEGHAGTHCKAHIHMRASWATAVYVRRWGGDGAAGARR